MLFGAHTYNEAPLQLKHHHLTSSPLQQPEFMVYQLCEANEKEGHLCLLIKKGLRPVKEIYTASKELAGEAGDCVFMTCKWYQIW